MSAILKKRWKHVVLTKFYEIFAVSAKTRIGPTSLQTTFLTEPTGIYCTMTYNHHKPYKIEISFFCPLSVNKTILGSVNC